MARPALIDRLPLELWVVPLAGLITLLQYGPALDAFFISDDFIWLDCAADTAGDIWHIFNRNLGNFFRPTSHLVFLPLWRCQPIRASCYGVRVPPF